MTETEIKQGIASAIKAFGSGVLTGNAIHLFNTLGYNTARQAPFTHKNYAEFKDNYGHAFTEKNFSADKALTKEWKSVDLLFQLTKDEVSGQLSLFDTKQVDDTIIETYLFFALELTKTEYTRTQLAQITREINKIFPMPVMLLFKHDNNLTLSVIDRRLNKKDEQKDVLKKITLIKDIAIANPHRAHIEILFDLSFDELKRVYTVTNFVELHNAWQKTLDTKELNKRFYRDLSNWYFWAVNSVSFPNDVNDDKDDMVYNSESVIRLLTRLIFIWFIKEKHLIPETIFDKREVAKIIKGFNGKDTTVYYRAILQNLFFATLNQRIEDREFAVEGTFEQNKKNYSIKNLYRYSADFTISKADVVTLFDGVPFLNGGLFDCLDFEDKNGKVLYMDGFSRNPHKQAQVPDELFFVQEKPIDLSAIYDDPRKSNERVKGLFEIFNNYKFTITENTPIEEEVALDPELLGRVFENLLASYNPETKTTARKQTGSFYTPREIVNYMVDESLKAHLKQKLEAESGMTPEDAEVGLEFLLAYNEKEHLFNEQQTTVLIKAIDNCKILDPACGSGAFPMGILHKLVHILHKLDPNNQKWQERQLDKANKIDDPTIRENLIADIETAFNNNELDYGRKLYLIENCIYGVDIQPIATQISKLRFFISLIVDQKADKARDNFDIRPLPNLETKFVAANTLIVIEKPKQQMSLFDNKDVEKLEAKLKDVRHRLFSAKSPAVKYKLKAEDQRLRDKMSIILEDAGWNNQSARQLAAWDPYDQHASSPWFDPEWMFNIKDGFDIVIGNPPYVFARNSATKGITQTAKDYYYANYSLAEYQVNLYPIFIEAGSRVLTKHGVLCFITPNNWLTINTNRKLRQFVLSQSKVLILNFYARVFESADVDAAIVLFQAGIPLSRTEHVLLLEWTTGPELIVDAPKLQFLSQPDAIINIEALKSGETGGLMEKIEKDTRPLNSIADVKSGLKAYEIGKGTPPQTREMKDGRVYHSSSKKPGYFTYLDGRDVCRYFLGWSGEYLKYGPNLGAPRGNFNLFSAPRILVRQIPSKPPYCINACFTSVTLLNDLNSMNIINITIKPQLVLAVLNSRLMTYWFIHKFGKMQRGIFPQFKVNELAMFPMPFTFAPHEDALIKLVNHILTAKQTDPSVDTTALEAEIDKFVYQLYGLTNEEIAILEGNVNSCGVLRVVEKDSNKDIFVCANNPD